MRRIGLLLVIILASAACNLSTSAGPPPASDTPSLTNTAPPFVIVTASPAGNGGGSSLLSLSPVSPTTVPMTSVPTLGTLCQVYTAYSGADPTNKLTLRSAPSAAASQVFLVVTNSQVLLVPNSQEVQAEGYHWLNMIYEQSAQMRYQGWIARDSYIRNGVRDPSVATLIPTGRQSPC